MQAEKDGNSVSTIQLEDAKAPQVTPRRTVRAKIFIDCSYEGDLMARAGISYTIGREPASQYGEPDNGVQCLDKHQFCDGVDPYVIPGDPSSGLLWGIMPEPMGNKGEGDNHIQAYNYRLTLTKNTPFRPITAKVPDSTVAPIFVPTYGVTVYEIFDMPLRSIVSVNVVPSFA